jgi:predicted ribosome quality control (RQC) complex YloA/Tae2 family protein
MAFDAVMTRAVTRELREKLLLGKIEKVYQPESDELVFNIHTRNGNLILFSSVSSQNPRLCLTSDRPDNPPAPLPFCMLLRKHLQGGRIVSIDQKDAERIIEISLETLNELGFTVSKKLIFEIMGKHSNVILVDMTTGKIIDSIKRISIDASRVRQILPGKIYAYPPSQDKIPYDRISEEELSACDGDKKVILSKVGGISPAAAQELAEIPPHERKKWLDRVISDIDSGRAVFRIYSDSEGHPGDFYAADLKDFEDCCVRTDYPSASSCICAFFDRRDSSNRTKQRARSAVKTVSSHLEKLNLKKQRLSEDLLKAENSDNLRIFGELLNANIHAVPPGADSVTVFNYYDGSEVKIPLDARYSAAKNAQLYFKRYGKSKTAVKEKTLQLEETESEILYLESVLTYLENAENESEIESIRNELIETGYIRRRKSGFKEKKFKASPVKYHTSSGLEILVGKNNRENDILTTKAASKKDIWLHTKDIPGSHVILRTDGIQPSAADIYEAASVAAYHSKARSSENVPVDYVPVKNVKKPAGAKPGMVIFTGNRTVWVNPKLPENINK